MPCICGKCDEKKKVTTKLALAARDVARFTGKPKQLVLMKDGVLIREPTDEYVEGVTPLVWVGPTCTDEEVATRVALYYVPQRMSSFEELLAALLFGDDHVDDINHN